jgi:hypothetical protein
VSLLLLAAGLAVAGCGGSSQLSASSLRSQASQVCTAADARMSAIPTPPSPSAAVMFLHSGLTVLRPELAALRALKPSGDLAEVYGISLRAFSRKLDTLSTTVHKIDTGGDPVKELQALQSQLGPLESTENGAWQALQIPACLNR